MSSGMNMEEAKKIADKMTYREAVMNCLYARCVPYRKATKIKMKRLLESIEAPYVDLDTPMHFTDEQKAWIKKYISINGERQRTDGINEGIEIGKERIIDDLNEIIQLNTMSRYFTKEDLYKSVYEKICEYLMNS